MRTLRRIAPVLLITVAAAYWRFLRPWHLQWGATPAEAEEALPGDAQVLGAHQQITHAITIHAPAADIWPWLVQIGQDKGGFYSYAWLENLAGCRMHNADRIVPEFQHVQVGDEVRLHPKAPPLPVTLVDPGRALVLGSNTGEPGMWGFYLKGVDENTTRLLVRSRGGDWIPGLGLLGRVAQCVLFEPAHFVMERKMLLNIKQRAEAASGERHSP